MTPIFQILTNDTKKNHLVSLLTLFEDAQEIWLATAFLKNSGLQLIKYSIKNHLKKGGLLKVIAGKHFGLTEPKALLDLYEIASIHKNASFFLDNALSATKVFHPKLFVFINGDNATVVSGSANITSGGMVENEEISLLVNMPVYSDNFTYLKKHFDTITNKKNAEAVNLLAIKRYEAFYNEQKEARKNQKTVPPKSSQEYDFDYSKLKKWLTTYDLKAFKSQVRQRELDYQKAEKLLDDIATKPLSQEKFEETIDRLVGKKGQAGLWKSGSLLRLRFKVYKYKQEFIDLVAFIKENRKKTAGEVFENAKKYVNKIEGARMNYVTEIMMTYEPERFANLNSNPITVLDKEAGLYIKSHSNSFNADDYNLYCEIIKEIGNEFDLKNMLEVDSFVNEIYWKLKNEAK